MQHAGDLMIELEGIAASELLLQAIEAIAEPLAFCIVGCRGQGGCRAVALRCQLDQFLQRRASNFPNGLLRIEIGLLLEIADLGGRMEVERAGVGLLHASEDLEQGRFARTIRADQSHPFSGPNFKRHAGQHGVWSVVFANFIDRKKNHRRESRRAPAGEFLGFSMGLVISSSVSSLRISGRRWA